MDNNSSQIKNDKLTNDIIFLQKRIKELFETEQYEKIAIVEKWLNELKEILNKKING